ncbi:methyltransferase family protein [Mycobacterium parmense]|uniref:Membrane protein n=1 Tax=Mycobacterium parmense TaxID=185642 RepID=A0A7I7YPQ0_9MYCO|nr:isoprenylcysteine carboxylmethyltransferase family protein [Mycobacterium parmense]MCV7349216.1 isoprenylcysteine carboxylmethyltransferase family protein [Mycobacterium parmense]ORW57182.1 hypothetical protein AWC20_13725 [Mycobacterium parmense]BBZ42903.1 membrane protein [Mycobacterium parmense]
MKTTLRAVGSGVVGLGVFCVLLFAPACTFAYWQGWIFLAVFTVSTWVPTIYLMRTNPAALQRRLRAGPRAETRPVQKAVMAVSFASLASTMAFSALDHRFGWSAVPAPVSLIGDALVGIGIAGAMLVIVQNSYAAATVTVEAGQSLACTGLYGVVRHPMYAADIVMMVGIPLALDSYWGLLLVIPGVVALVIRILDEEKLLTAELPGYREYAQRVRYRLLPHVW